jgi:hypothetical protein
LGDKAVPHLLQVYQTNKGWDHELEEALDDLLHNLGPRAKAALDPLLTIANNERIPTAVRIHAVHALGAIGLPAERAEPDLQKLTDDYDPSVRAAAIEAILRMGCSPAAPILAQRLDDPKYADRRWVLLRDIAELHARGRSVGVIVARYLASDDWDLRVGAARTLGYIGYREKNAELIKLLDGAEDWRLVLSAAEALGRMEVREALPALTKVSQYHWYPPVRSAAVAAMEGIRSHVHREAEYFASEYISYTDVGRELEKLSVTEANRLRFPFVEIASPLPKVALADVRQFGIVRSGIKVDDGFLVGRFVDSGGDIAFTDFDQVLRTIATPPYTEAIYQTVDGVFAITGQEDNARHTGLIYRIEKDAGGEWRARAWRQLPGPPQFSRLLQDGRIFVNTTRGMTVVSADGELTLLNRKQALRTHTAPR